MAQRSQKKKEKERKKKTLNLLPLKDWSQRKWIKQQKRHLRSRASHGRPTEKKRSGQWFQPETTIVSNLEERERWRESEGGVGGGGGGEERQWVREVGKKCEKERRQIDASTHRGVDANQNTLDLFLHLPSSPPPVQFLPPPPPPPTRAFGFHMCSGSGKREASWGNQRCKCFVQRLGNSCFHYVEHWAFWLPSVGLIRSRWMERQEMISSILARLSHLSWKLALKHKILFIYFLKLACPLENADKSLSVACVQFPLQLCFWSYCTFFFILFKEMMQTASIFRTVCSFLQLWVAFNF